MTNISALNRGTLALAVSVLGSTVSCSGDSTTSLANDVTFGMAALQIGVLLFMSLLIAFASVSMVAPGAFWTKVSPGWPFWNAYKTRSTASSIVIMKRVIEGSVTVKGFPSCSCPRKSGITDPRLAITFP